MGKFSGFTYKEAGENKFFFTFMKLRPTTFWQPYSLQGLANWGMEVRIFTKVHGTGS